MSRETLPSHVRTMLTAMQYSSAVIGLYSPGDRLAWANPAFRRAYAVAEQDDLSFDEMIRHCYQTRQGAKIDGSDIDAWLALAHRKRRSRPQRAFVADLHDGRWLWIEETTLQDGWLLVIGSDITALKQHEHTLSQLRDAALQEAYTDALTGLYSRRYVLAKLEEAIPRHRELAEPLSIALLDLDHFKSINDNHGHAVGDKVLQHFACYLLQRVRQEDRIGRIGGEEFLLLMPGTPGEVAHRTVERLRRGLLASRPLADLPALRYSLSAGVAMLGGLDTLDSLFQRADRMLYAAKAAGRNRTRREP